MAAVIWGAHSTPYIAVRPILEEGQTWYHAAWRGSNAIPSWSWKGCEGRKIEVEVYTKAGEVELLINGVSMGRQSVQGCKAVFPVSYQPGELKAVACHADGSIIESTLHSAVGGTKIVITPESRPEPGKLLFAEISLCGENGEVEAHADETLQISVSGGKLLAFGSAKPNTEEEFHTGVYTTYYGRSLAAILVGSNELQISVTGKNTHTVWRNMEK